MIDAAIACSEKTVAQLLRILDRRSVRAGNPEEILELLYETEKHLREMYAYRRQLLVSRSMD